MKRQERRIKIGRQIIKCQAGIVDVTGWQRRRKVSAKRERDDRTICTGWNKEREMRKEEKEASQEATRGSNLPGRRDFASEAEANC